MVQVFMWLNKKLKNNVLVCSCLASSGPSIIGPVWSIYVKELGFDKGDEEAIHYCW